MEMNMNSVTSITPVMNNENNLSSNHSILSLEAVLQQLEQWRATKDPHKKISIPDDLWHKIFKLAKLHSPTKIRGLFGISTTQYNKKYEQLYPTQNAKQPVNKTALENINFYEVKPRSSKPMDLEPYVPETTTIIVEFCRADGKIMKIHTATNNFNDLINAFYAGEK